jgi:hypothetical protein
MMWWIGNTGSSAQVAGICTCMYPTYYPFNFLQFLLCTHMQISVVCFMSLACNGGYYWGAGTCVECSAPYYCPGASGGLYGDQETCPNGGFTTVTLASSQSLCTCPTGHRDDSQQGDCAACLPGYWMNGASCNECGSGYYCPNGIRQQCFHGYTQTATSVDVSDCQCMSIRPYIYMQTFIRCVV